VKKRGKWQPQKLAGWIRREKECSRFWLRFTYRPQKAREVLGRELMKLVEGFDSNYRYILVAARRARQLQGGAPPVIDTGSRKPCRIAQDEIKAGKVKWLIPELPKLAVVAATETLNKVFAEDA
jgi:DNA-directed RNA polymerase subunit omega